MEKQNFNVFMSRLGSANKTSAQNSAGLTIRVLPMLPS